VTTESEDARDYRKALGEIIDMGDMGDPYQADAISMLARIVRDLLPPDPRPENWPPTMGQIWQDRHGERWICAGRNGRLTCLARPAGDNAEDIWREHGPLSFVWSFNPREEEAPF
jgi:hypothetical protein